MLDTYHSIAKLYRLLSRLVFANNIYHIQQLLIDALPDNGKALLIGGGSGDILPYLEKRKPQLKIDYQEASSEMIRLAKKRSTSKNITFIHSDQVQGNDYLHIICPFFLDTLSEERIIKFISSANVSTTWYVADFELYNIQNYRLLRSIQIRLAILFFKIFTKHEPNQLPKIREIFLNQNYKQLFSSSLGKGFYIAATFQLNQSI